MNKDELKAIYFSFYDQLKPEHAEKAKANHDEERSKVYPSDHSDAVMNGFNWDASPEGMTYWNSIFNELLAKDYPLQLTPETCEAKAKEVMHERPATQEDYDKLDEIAKGRAIFPSDDDERQKYAVGTFICEFFPHAIAELARFSYDMQQKHNPDAPMGWAKDKSIGNGNQIFRHQMDGEFREVAWRGLEQLERFLMKMEPFNEK